MTPPLHILTTGISLLSNYSKHSSIEIGKTPGHHQEVAGYLEADPVKNCAEINSLHAQTGFLDRTTNALEVTLVTTETELGKCVASLLERFLKNRVAHVHRIPVRGFDKPARDFDAEFARQEAVDALNAMRESVREHVKRMRKDTPDREVFFNCTGGFKAECAVLYALGARLNIPVYYLHESFKVCVTLPLGD